MTHSYEKVCSILYSWPLSSLTAQLLYSTCTANCSHLRSSSHWSNPRLSGTPFPQIVSHTNIQYCTGRIHIVPLHCSTVSYRLSQLVTTPGHSESHDGTVNLTVNQSNHSNLTRLATNIRVSHTILEEVKGVKSAAYLRKGFGAQTDAEERTRIVCDRVGRGVAPGGYPAGSARHVRPTVRAQTRLGSIRTQKGERTLKVCLSSRDRQRGQTASAIHGRAPCALA